MFPNRAYARRIDSTTLRMHPLLPLITVGLPGWPGSVSPMKHLTVTSAYGPGPTALTPTTFRYSPKWMHQDNVGASKNRRDPIYRVRRHSWRVRECASGRFLSIPVNELTDAINRVPTVFDVLSLICSTSVLKFHHELESMRPTGHPTRTSNTDLSSIGLKIASK
jgi:hypothetical protein